MTAQTPDVLILNGRCFDLYTTPLERYFKRIEWQPKYARWCSNNLRGYVARWEVFGERLFLTGLFGMSWIVPAHLVGKLPPDPDPFEGYWVGVKSLRLPDLFPDQAPLVFAEWVTERLVVPTGPRLVYMHLGFGSLHAAYRTIDVEAGYIHSIRDWDGREWARETGRFWPDDEWYKNHPEALVWPERDIEKKEASAESESDGEPEEDEDIEADFRYELAQSDALRKPCGQAPSE